MYRMQIYDRKTTGMHWHIHKDGSHHYHEYRKANKRMEVAVAIGTDPAITYAATAPMPRGVDEMILAGFIRQKPVVMVKGVTVDIAKFLIDCGVHPPTIFFPLIVHGALMIEPTETESKETLDEFVEAMLAIAREARETPEALHDAPTRTPVGRLDEARAARRPVLRWVPPGS